MIIGGATNAFNVYNAGGNSRDIWIGAAIGAVSGVGLRFPLMMGVNLNITRTSLYLGALNVATGSLNRVFGLNTQSHENIGYDMGINFIVGYG